MAEKKPKIHYQADLSKYLGKMMGDPTGKELASAALKYMGFFDGFASSVVNSSKAASKNVAANYATSIDALIQETELSLDQMSKQTNTSLGKMLKGATSDIRKAKPLIQKELSAAFAMPKIDTDALSKSLHSSSGGGLGGASGGGMMEALGGSAGSMMLEVLNGAAALAIGLVVN